MLTRVIRCMYAPSLATHSIAHSVVVVVVVFFLLAYDVFDPLFIVRSWFYLLIASNNTTYARIHARQRFEIIIAKLCCVMKKKLISFLFQIQLSLISDLFSRFPPLSICYMYLRSQRIQFLFLVYRYYIQHRTLASMNFDNPVYRKTTEDQFSLEKNLPARVYPSSIDEEVCNTAMWFMYTSLFIQTLYDYSANSNNIREFL